MLTKLSSAIAIAILTSGAAVALDAAPAQAGGGGSCGNLCVHVGRNRVTPGRPAGGGGRGGGRGGGGKAAPMPCPGAVNCNTLGLGNAAPVPIPRIPTIDVAYNARNQLQLPAPHVHTSPAGKTYVQLRTGLWVDPADFAHEQASAAVPGAVVTAIAEPKSITWNMGESTVTCTTAGSPNGTRCGYSYQRSSANRPNGKYAIAVTVSWDTHWTCQGDCDAAGGNFPDPVATMTTNATLTVGEVQTESRPG